MISWNAFFLGAPGTADMAELSEKTEKVNFRRKIPPNILAHYLTPCLCEPNECKSPQ